MPIVTHPAHTAADDTLTDSCLDWYDRGGHELVSFTDHAASQFAHLVRNDDLEIIDKLHISTMLPICHRMPFYGRFLDRLGITCTLVARFLDLDLDVEYVHVDNRFVVLRVSDPNNRKGGRVSCRVPKVGIQWSALAGDIYRVHRMPDA